MKTHTHTIAGRKTNSDNALNSLKICAYCIKSTRITRDTVICIHGNAEDVDVIPIINKLPRQKCTHTCDNYEIDYDRINSVMETNKCFQQSTEGTINESDTTVR